MFLEDFSRSEESRVRKLASCPGAARNVPYLFLGNTIVWQTNLLFYQREALTTRLNGLWTE